VSDPLKWIPSSPPPETGKLKIAFVGPEFIPWRPMDFGNLWDSPRCLTGTESSIVSFARELTKLGHQVSIYYHEGGTSFEGVTLLPISRLAEDSKGLDVVCSWATDPAYSLRGISASALRVYYATGNSFDAFYPNFEEDVDLFLSPSENHRQYMRKWTLTHVDKWDVLPLGCYIDDYDLSAKVPGRVVHISSPDRGLHWLLQEWSKLRQLVPGANLRIFYYGMEDYVRNAAPRGAPVSADLIEHGCRARYIDAAIRRLNNEGVTLVGSASRTDMKRELSEAMVLAYPCDTTLYSEGFSVSTLEGCASGALPVIVGVDALGSIYGNYVPCVEPPAKKNIDKWRDFVVMSLTDKEWRSEWVAKARSFARHHHYPNLSAKLVDLFVKAIEKKRRSPAVSTSSRVRMDVVLTPFAMGESATVDPENYLDVSHGGGSLIGCLHLVHALRRRGDYDVRTYARFSRNVDGFLPLESFNGSEPRDAVFTFYDTTPLRAVDQNTNCLRIASHHTYLPPDLGFTTFADINTAPSWHALSALRSTFHPRGTWYVLPNGVADPAVTHQPINGRVLHHASSDRGLHVLLGVWPKIRARVPHATLHVIGDVEAAHWGQAPLFPAFARSVTGKRVLALREAKRVALAAGGIEFIGKVSRDTLRINLAHAACFAYPCAPDVPCETFSISTMECMRAGVPVVLSPSDALGFYDDYALMVPSPVEEHTDEFVDAVVRVLITPSIQLFYAAMAGRWAKRYTHDRMAAVLNQIIRRHLP